jgi:ABC-2 type transport system permease protein
MKAALIAEYRKLVTTRLWWILLALMATYLVFISAVLAFSLTVDSGADVGFGIEPLSGEHAATTVYSLVNSIGYVFPLIIGSLAMTTEFRHQTITQTLLVEPRRSVLLAAKLLATVPIGLAYGVVAVLAVVLGGAPILALQGDGAFLGDADVVTSLVLGVLVVAIWAVVGAAFGSVVTNQVAAIVIILSFTQFVEPIARVGLGAVDELSAVSAFLPGAAADAVIGASVFSTAGTVDLLSRVEGAVVLLTYAAVFAAIGRATTLRRDIN